MKKALKVIFGIIVCVVSWAVWQLYSDASLKETCWQITHIGGEALPATHPARNPLNATLEFSKEGKIGGRLCDSFTGKYRTYGNFLYVPRVDLFSTLACSAKDLAALEDWLKIMLTAGYFRNHNDSLTIYTVFGTIQARSKPLQKTERNPWDSSDLECR
jgi:hypothetical protein